jgi:uncharacterized protein YciI
VRRGVSHRADVQERRLQHENAGSRGEEQQLKAVIIGESSGASMEANMAVYPRHKVVVDKFVGRGEVIGIGPFTDLGNMGIFRTREAAEAFAKEDPFILEGLLKSFVIRDWNDTMLE